MTHSTPTTPPDFNTLLALARGAAARLGMLDAQMQVEALGLSSAGQGSSQWSNAVLDRIKLLVEPDDYSVRTYVIATRTQLLHAHYLLTPTEN